MNFAFTVLVITQLACLINCVALPDQKCNSWKDCHFSEICEPHNGERVCHTLSRHGESCDSNQECKVMDQNSHCSSKRCTCIDNYELETRSGKCVSKDKVFAGHEAWCQERSGLADDYLKIIIGLGSGLGVMTLIGIAFMISTCVLSSKLKAESFSPQYDSETIPEEE